MRSQASQFVTSASDLALSDETHYSAHHVSRYDLLKIENHLERNSVSQDCRRDFEEEVWIEFWNNVRR